MRVAMVSDLHARGGAAVAASRLAEGLAAAGHDVRRLAGFAGDENDDGPIEIRTIPREYAIRLKANRLPRRLRDAVRGALNDLAERALRRALEALDPRVVSLHNLHGMRWPPRFAEVCADVAPTVWTLHDMWSFTGRCGYSGDCQRYLDGCTAECPTPEEPPELSPSLIADAWKRRRSIVEQTPDLHAVCPSVWLREEATRTVWPRERTTVIPNGLPLDAYAPGGEPSGPSEGSLRVLVATSQDPRKGDRFVSDVLDGVEVPTEVVCIGRGDPEIGSASVDVHRLGFVSKARKRRAFREADLYLHTAIQDNFPNVILEAMASGTAVAAFEVGGIPEMVDEGVTGFLGPVGEPRRLGARISKLAKEPAELSRMGDRALAEARKRFSLDRQASDYESLFRHLIEGGAG